MNNNNEQFDKFIRDFDKIRMSANEKNEIRNRLEVFAREKTTLLQISPYFTHVTFFKKTLAVALIAVLFISASKPASAKALPGELLYPVKIIHEKIVAATIKIPEKKIQFEIKQTETRIKEAVQLAKQKKLDDEKQTQLAVEIKEHVNGVSEKIEEIKQNDPERALTLNSDLKTILKINSEALKEVTKINEETPSKQNTDEAKNLDIEAEKKPLIKEDILEKPKNLETEQNGTTTELELLDAEETQITEDNGTIDNEKKPTLIVDNSSAYIILDSIKDDIEKTEIIKESIEDGIKLDAEAINMETIDSKEIEDAATATVEIEMNEPTEESEIEKIINEIEFLIEDMPDLEKIDSAEGKADEIEISENVQSDITSLEKILEAEEKLKVLLFELSIEREQKNIDVIKTLIDKKEFGQAYINIQNEIESLSESKLSKDIESELGISIETEEDILLEE